MCNRNVALIGILICLGWRALLADVILVSDPEQGAAPELIGNEKEADAFFSPASTFKMILTLAGLEQGKAAPETRWICRDAFLPQRPMELNLTQALYYSSNEYFLHLEDLLKPDDFLEMGRRVHFGEEKIALAKVKREDWKHGGAFLITPRQEHAFMRSLARQELPVSKTVGETLQRVLQWPDSHSGVHAWGKTGSWDHCYWFTGLAERGNRRRVITVLLTQNGSTRDQAIARFYEQAEKVP